MGPDLADVAVLADSQAQHGSDSQNAGDQDNSGVVAGGLDDAAGGGGHRSGGIGGRFVNMPVAVLVLVRADLGMLGGSSARDSSGNSLAVDAALAADGAIRVQVKVIDNDIGDAVASQSFLDDGFGIVGIRLDPGDQSITGSFGISLVVEIFEDQIDFVFADIVADLFLARYSRASAIWPSVAAKALVANTPAMTTQATAETSFLSFILTQLLSQ